MILITNTLTLFLSLYIYIYIMYAGCLESYQLQLQLSRFQTPWPISIKSFSIFVPGFRRIILFGKFLLENHSTGRFLDSILKIKNSIPGGSYSTNELPGIFCEVNKILPIGLWGRKFLLFYWTENSLSEMQWQITAIIYLNNHWNTQPNLEPRKLERSTILEDSSRLHFVRKLFKKRFRQEQLE